MCGIIGIQSEEPVVGQLYNGLMAIQHRGQDAAGIVTFDGRFHLKKGYGLVRDIFERKHMKRLAGTMGLGHVRYPTVGNGSARDAQPFVLQSPYGLALAHNGNVTNFRQLKAELTGRRRRLVNSDCDAEVILHVLADELEGRLAGTERDVTPDDLFAAVGGLFRRVRGAYSVVAIVAGRGLLVFRDPFGIRPLIMGERRTGQGGRSWCAASESVVLDLLDFHRTRDVRPGEAVFVRPDGEVVRCQVAPPNPHPCIFELIYFARPDSFLDQVSVYKTRVRLGRCLAETWRRTGLEADVIIPVPESARPAAIAMAQELGMKYSEGLVKNRYIGRTFIMPGQEARTSSIRRKLNAIQMEFRGKRVILVDDSIVRGNTSRELVRLAREAGAAKVYFLSYSAPIRHPCYYGIDMQTRDEFIARGHTEEEIAAAIGADRVVYQRFEDMIQAARHGNPAIPAFCAACFTGEYPAGGVSAEEQAAIEAERARVSGAGAGGGASASPARVGPGSG